MGTLYMDAHGPSLAAVRCVGGSRATMSINGNIVKAVYWFADEVIATQQ